MKIDRTIVVGAGIGGLTAAAVLARRGVDVTVIEKAARPGGKMRTVEAAGRPIDAGPTVFTMRSLFREIAEDAGFDLDAALALTPVETLARHAWAAKTGTATSGARTGGEAPARLDLFVDPQRSADAIGDFSGAAEAKRFLAFHAEAAHVFRTLDRSFIRAAEPSRAKLVMGAGLRGLADLARIRPFATLWSTLGQMFEDPRLRQLFGRYATYCGSSPFEAPATLMLVAHVEMDGVWLVDGGMARVAEVFAEQAAAHGARFRYGAEVSRIEVENGRVSGVRLADGEAIEAGSVVFNGDSAALGAGLLGERAARAGPKTSPAERSLSAVTFCRVARTSGFPLARHTVFFSDDYEAEFTDVFRRHRLPERPTVYVCAQDRDDGGRLASSAPPSWSGLTGPPTPDVEHDAERGSSGQAGGRRSPETSSDTPERLMLLVNAPAIGDHYQFGSGEIARCERHAMELLARCGLAVEGSEAMTTSPSDFARMFPGTGGALYGPASHGAHASFRRATARTSLKGLYLAGGSVHPGPGIPMAALSGWQAAQSLIRDRASTAPSRPAATPGGISTPKATTEPTG